MNCPFPKRSVVYPGCTLAMIAEAVWLLDCCPLPSRSWCDNTYFYNAGDGDHAVITFQEEALVGTLFNHESHRSPFACGDAFDVETFFRGMPAGHRPLTERCLTYSYMEGMSSPLVTAAFWDDGDYLTAAEPWDQVWKHGGDVIRRELIEDLDTALSEWQPTFQLSPSQIAFVRALFLRKMARPNALLELEPSEVEFLRATLAGETGLDQEALWFLRAGAPMLEQATGRTRVESAKQALACIGIQMPPLS